jgi:hypothetical protein
MVNFPYEIQQPDTLWKKEKKRKKKEKEKEKGKGQIDKGRLSCTKTQKRTYRKMLICINWKGRLLMGVLSPSFLASPLQSVEKCPL